MVIIMKDNYSAYRGNNSNGDQIFQKILSKNNAVLEPVKLNDRHALGVIDMFAKNLKCVLSKEFLGNKDTAWVSVLQKLSRIQHHTTHSIRPYNT